MAPLNRRRFDFRLRSNITVGFLLFAGLVATAFAGLQEPQPTSTAASGTEQTSKERMQVPGTNYEFVFGAIEFPPANGASGGMLITALVTWISDNFELPANYDLPRIERANPSTITALRHAGHSSIGQREVVAVYVTEAKTIYLREDWTGRTPAEISVLVHEIVHHLQNIGGLKFECPEEREQLAYKAQERWLGLFGRDLLQDFEIDPFTLLVSTKCFF